MPHGQRYTILVCNCEIQVYTDARYIHSRKQTASTNESVSTSHNDAARIRHPPKVTTLGSISMLYNLLYTAKILTGHVDDSVANPIWPSSSAIDPWWAVELLFRAASQKRNACVNACHDIVKYQTSSDYP